MQKEQHSASLGGTREDARDSCEVSIESLAAGGDGVAHLPDGRVIFTPFAAPGDRVRVHVRERHARYLRGEIQDLIEPGPARRSPRCPVFGRCGGCAWQHVESNAQRSAKRAIVRQALIRIGGCSSGIDPLLVESPAEYAYRSRARVLVRSGRVGYRERYSHRLCSVSCCPVLAEPLERELGRFAKKLARRPRRRESEWELAMGSSGETRSARLGRNGRSRSTQRVTLCPGEDAIELSPGTFSQGNLLLLEPLRRAVSKALGEGGRLLELYAGAGFFTLPLARRFECVTAVEAAPGAVSDLRRNLARSGSANVTVLASKVEAALASSVIPEPAAVLLDPPRCGLGAEACIALAGTGARRLVYLSCDPATLARDVSRLREAGYELAAASAFDLFPQTPHVETLAMLVRE